MSRGIPADAAALDEVIRSRLADGYRVTFTIRPGGRAVGITSVLLDPHDPSVRVGGTLLDPGCAGRGPTPKSRGSWPESVRQGRLRARRIRIRNPTRASAHTARMTATITITTDNAERLLAARPAAE
jgi:hypothetical protein